MPKSNGHSSRPLSEEELIILELRDTVIGLATALIAVMSGLLSALFFCHSLGWFQLNTLELVSTTVQVRTAVGLALFAGAMAAARQLRTPRIALHISRALGLLLTAVVVGFLPESTLESTFPQAIWLPVLFAAATVSSGWAYFTALLTISSLAFLHPEAPVFRNPAAITVFIGVLALIMALRWLYDAGLRSAARSHQRVLTNLRVDALTGLPNRTRLMELLGEQAAADGGLAAIAIARFDIDGFGPLCDAVGTAAADDILRQVAADLRATLGADLRAARIGADDFAILLPVGPGHEAPGRLIEELVRRLGEPRTLRDQPLRLTLKTGLAYGGPATESAESLLHRADLALDEAKASGQRLVESHPHTTAAPASRRRFEIAQRLFGATERGELHVAYQPIVDLATGRICKAEALVRWDSPELGAVGPGEFIAVAEETGAIHELGDWVALEAARFTAHLIASGHPGFQMSINRSPIQFRADGDAEPAVLRTIRGLGLSLDAIILEITEGVLLDGRESNRTRLADLRAAGLGLALDDFGTGYASLAQLHAFEIDIVKIDRRFVAGLAEGNREHALCAGIISLSHSLGMKVVAEGVETAEQRDLLLGLGCDFGQGWLFGRPIRQAPFEAMLQARK